MRWRKNVAITLIRLSATLFTAAGENALRLTFIESRRDP